ncbi:hypothetical protein [Psychrobium sp. 1_MG-2023]|uniref:hypothetical protein n=1 Tax=Psychrobium sp. 1_MG-2023 TaxID=3062624 RepID=UPI0026CEB22D|nr:hypothetical protein [Psychrobium sp. 1_MG-2023]MDP2561515.1 hypothetical protein [Psychrobium sp. 1_MG-2023]
MEKIVLRLLCLCLIVAGSTHVFDNIYYGLFPYQFVPTWINIYWSLLGVLDYCVVLLLLKYRKIGLVAVLVLMATNVAINSFVLYSLEALESSIALQTQTLFLGFCIGVVPWLWKTPLQLSTVAKADANGEISTRITE